MDRSVVIVRKLPEEDTRFVWSKQLKEHQPSSKNLHKNWTCLWPASEFRHYSWCDGNA